MFASAIANVKRKRKVVSIRNFQAGLNYSLSENAMPFSQSPCVYNFSTASGALSKGVGVSNLEVRKVINGMQVGIYLPSMPGFYPRKIFHFTKFDYNTNKRKDKIMVYTQDKKIWYFDTADETSNIYKRLGSFELDSEPSFLNYNLNGEDTLIITSKSNNMIVWDGESTPRVISGAPKVTSMCVHYERLFVTTDDQKNTLWFSDDLNPLNWNVNLNEAGFIDMPSGAGKMLKVISFMDYLYIFREYGITRVSAFAKQENFSVNELFVTSGKIFTDSVCVCGDKILFLAEDGVYVFDGLNTRRVLHQLDGFFMTFKDNRSITNANSNACYYNGKYYLLCQGRYKMHKSDLEYDHRCCNTLLIFDIQTASLEVYKDIAIINLAKLLMGHTAILGAVIYRGDDTRICQIDDSANILNLNYEKYWRLPTSDYGEPSKIKQVEEITVQTAKPLTVVVICDGKKRTLQFPGKDTPQTKKLKFSGYQISFVMETTAFEPHISLFEAVLYVAQ